MKLITSLGKAKKNGLRHVYVTCYINRERVMISTGIYVESDGIDDNGNLLGKKKQTQEQQILINNVKKRITQIEVKYKLQHKQLTAEILKSEYETPQVTESFIAFFSHELRKRKNHIEPATYKQNLSVLRKIQQFKEEIKMYELDEQLILDFKDYMKSIGNMPSTVEKNIKTIKTYVSKAIKKDLIHKNPFEEIKIRQIESNPIYLTPEELYKISSLYQEHFFEPKQMEILRPFLFACFTGLRVSDIKRLKHSDIIGNTIVIIPQKTKKTQKLIKVPLCNNAKKYIEKNNSNYIFDGICEQVTNRHLKYVADLLALKKAITFHSSRHTFATLYYRQTKDLFGLQKLLGHSTIKQTQIYAHIIDADTANNIMQLDHIY